MTSTGQDIGGSTNPYYAGDSLQLTINVDDENGSDKDLTGASVAWGVARSRGGSSVLSGSTSGVSVSVTNAATGEVTVSIDPGVTDDLAGAYVHELEVTDAAGDQDTVAVGEFIVTEDVA